MVVCPNAPDISDVPGEIYMPVHSVHAADPFKVAAISPGAI
jgi:hypothetical protein